MDQSLSLPRSSSPSASRSAEIHSATASPPGSAAEEEPESPGRIPRSLITGADGSDPLAEGVALLGGVLLAVMALLVPVASVVGDSQSPVLTTTGRLGW
jgi:hypothetical protein